MGCYDGAEVCKLVGSYLLTKLSNIADKKSIGLYRYDGLATLQNFSGPQTEQKRYQSVQNCRFKNNYPSRLVYCQLPRCKV